MTERMATVPGFVERCSRRLFGDIALQHQRFMLRGASGSLGLNIGLTVVQFATGVVLARLLMASGYGVYTYALSWAMLLAVAASFGLPRFVVRETARHAALAEWNVVAGVWHWANRVTVVAGMGVAVLGLIILFLARHALRPEVVAPTALALATVPVFAFLRLGQAKLQGVRRVVVAQMPEMLVHPLTFLIVIVIAAVFWKGVAEPLRVLAFYVGSLTCALMVMTYNVGRLTPRELDGVSPVVRAREWFPAAASLLLLGGLHIVNSRADVLILGTMKGADAVGIYGVASRGAELVGFVFLPITRVLEPLVAALHGKQERAELQRVVTISARIGLVIAAAIVLLYVVAGRVFLLLFGREFVAGYVPLLILSGVQLVNIFCGGVSLLLVLTGHERLAAAGVAISAGANVILNPPFISVWGVEGAAFATFSSTLLWNGAMVYWLVRSEGIDPTALGTFARPEVAPRVRED